MGTFAVTQQLLLLLESESNQYTLKLLPPSGRTSASKLELIRKILKNVKADGRLKATEHKGDEAGLYTF